MALVATGLFVQVFIVNTGNRGGRHDLYRSHASMNKPKKKPDNRGRSLAVSRRPDLQERG